MIQYGKIEAKSAEEYVCLVCEQGYIPYNIAIDKGLQPAVFALAKKLCQGTQQEAKVASPYASAYQFLYAWCCDVGFGCSEDEAEATKWYNLAAELGHKEAKNRLGRRVKCSIQDGEAIVGKQPSTITTAYIPASITVDGKTYPVTSICEEAFKGCENLATVFFAAGSKLTSIGDSAFWGCTALTIYAEAAEKPTEWVSGWNNYDYNNSTCPVVWNCKTNDVAADGYIYTIQDGVRYGIKNGVAMVAKQTRTITTANIAASIPYQGTIYPVTSIRYEAFKDCKNLATVTFAAGSKLTSIGGTAFWGCTSLTSITIPSSVTSIEGLAFWGCTSLASITIPSSVTSISGYAFSGCTALASIMADPANANYQSIEGNLYNKAGTTLLQYAVGKTATSFNIPSSVTSIEYGAFNGCTNLATVTFEAGSKLTSIGERAFAYCTSLTSITIPSSVTSIGNYAFDGCTKLVTVTFAAGSKLTSIESRVFSGCTSLAAITIPSSVTSIWNRAFDGCSSLAAITIPSSVTSIGWNAFDGCTALTIYAEAAREPSGWDSDWNKNGGRVYWYRDTAPTGSGYWHYVDGVPTKW